MTPRKTRASKYDDVIELVSSFGGYLFMACPNKDKEEYKLLSKVR